MLDGDAMGHTKHVVKLIRQYERLVAGLDRSAVSYETEPEALEQLSELADLQIQASVSMNPKTPSHVMERYLKTFCGTDARTQRRASTFAAIQLFD